MNLEKIFLHWSPCTRPDVLCNTSGAHETRGTNGDGYMTTGRLGCVVRVGVAKLAEQAICE